jgi:hypothetical protein
LFHGRVYSRRLRGKDWTWRSNILVMCEYAKHEVSLSMEIYRNGLDKVNRLSLSVGEMTKGTVKVVIVPRATAKISKVKVGRSRQARPPLDAPASRTTTFICIIQQLIHPQHHLLFAPCCSYSRDHLHTIGALPSTNPRPRHRQSHSAKTLHLTRTAIPIISAHAWTTHRHVFITAA